MKRLAMWFGLCVVLWVAAVALSPYYALYRLKSAYDEGDYDHVAAMVDYERVRPHMQQALRERLQTTLSNNDVLAGLTLIMPDAKDALTHQAHQLIDEAVTEAVTADNLKRLLNQDISSESKKLAAAWAVASDYIDYQKLIKDIIVSGGDWQSASAAQEPIVRERVIQKFGQAASDKPSFGYCGYDCFYVSGAISGQPIGATLYRQGLFGWKIEQVQLP